MAASLALETIDDTSNDHVGTYQVDDALTTLLNELFPSKNKTATGYRMLDDIHRLKTPSSCDNDIMKRRRKLADDIGAKLDDRLKDYVKGLTPTEPSVKFETPIVAYRNVQEGIEYTIEFELNPENTALIATPRLRLALTAYVKEKPVEYNGFKPGFHGDEDRVYAKLFAHIVRGVKIADDVSTEGIETTNLGYSIKTKPIKIEDLDAVMREFGAVVRAIDEHQPALHLAAYLLKAAYENEKRAAAMHQALGDEKAGDILLTEIDRRVKEYRGIQKVMNTIVIPPTHMLKQYLL